MEVGSRKGKGAAVAGSSGNVAVSIKSVFVEADSAEKAWTKRGKRLELMEEETSGVRYEKTSVYELSAWMWSEGIRVLS